MESHDAKASSINNLPAGILHTIFALLGPRDLCACSATCTLWNKLNKDKAANTVWKSFYTSRWRVTGAAGADVCWQTKYGSKMKQGKSWTGKYEHDSLYGHKAGVKSLRLLPSHGMLLTGSLDRTVRLWDLKYGMPLGISAPHGGTVRSVALDQHLLASGSSDNVIRLWHARNATDGSSILDPAEASSSAALLQGFDGSLGLGIEGFLGLDAPADQDAEALMAVPPVAAAASMSAAAEVHNDSGLTLSALNGRIPYSRGPYSVITGEADESLFDLSLPGQQLRGHIGPITSLCATDSNLYSGSWDYTVRCWRRGSWDCTSVLKYQDWVWSVVARGGLLLVASGAEVHVHDLPTGKLVRKFENLHEGSVSCLEGTHSGKIMFSGAADGLLMAHDLRMRDPSRVLWHHNGGVHGLALEDPWLVSVASDGTVIMHNTEAALPNYLHSASVSNRAYSAASSSNNSLPTRRTLHSSGQSGPMYCVDIAESWLAAGGEASAVRTWDFTKAAEAAARAAAARAARSNSKRTAKQRKAAGAVAAGRSRAASVQCPTVSVPVPNGCAAAASDGWASRIAAGCSGLGNSGSRGKGSYISSSVWNNAAGAASSSNSGAAAAAINSDSRDVVMSDARNNGELSRRSSGKAARGLLAAAAAAAASASASMQAEASCELSFDRYHHMQHNHRAGMQQQKQQQSMSAGSAGDAGTRASTGCGNSANTRHVPVHHNRHARQVHYQMAHSPPWSQGSYTPGSSPQQMQWQGPHGGSPQQHCAQYMYGSSPQQQQQWWGGTSPPNSRLHCIGHQPKRRHASNLSRGP